MVDALGWHGLINFAASIAFLIVLALVPFLLSMLALLASSVVFLGGIQVDACVRERRRGG